MPKKILNLKDHILENACSLMTRLGYDQFNIRELATQCGIASGTLYNYFPNKDELLTAIIQKYLDDFMKSFNSVSNEPIALFPKLQKIYDLIKNFVDKSHDIWKQHDVLNIKILINKHQLKKQQIFDQLTQMMALLIQKELDCKTISLLEIDMLPNHFAAFIVSNFFIMAHKSALSYDQFERILQRLTLV